MGCLYPHDLTTGATKRARQSVDGRYEITPGSDFERSPLSHESPLHIDDDKRSFPRIQRRKNMLTTAAFGNHRFDIFLGQTDIGHTDPLWTIAGLSKTTRFLS